MNLREALTAARSQIAWILALTLSTAVIVQLERIDLRNEASLLNRNPLFSGSGTETGSALEAARAALRLGPDAPELRAQLLTALILHALATDPAPLRAEARALMQPAAVPDAPVLAAAQAMARAVFDAP